MYWRSSYLSFLPLWPYQIYIPHGFMLLSSLVLLRWWVLRWACSSLSGTRALTERTTEFRQQSRRRLERLVSDCLASVPFLLPSAFSSVWLPLLRPCFLTGISSPQEHKNGSCFCLLENLRSTCSLHEDGKRNSSQNIGVKRDIFLIAHNFLTALIHMKSVPSPGIVLISLQY